MKKYLNGVLVVEGKEDASYLSNYIESEIVVVNGFELSKDVIDYLKNKNVIALLDPDDAGEEIRKKLNEMLPNIHNVSIEKAKCTRGIKTGVAECEISEILGKLAVFYTEKPNFCSNITKSDLYGLGLSSDKNKREIVSEKLNLGRCNAKTFYQRLAYNGISLEELKKVVKEIEDGN